MARRQTTLLDTTEVARRLGVSLSTVWRRVRSGSLPSLRKGGRRLVPESAVVAAAMPSEQRSIAPLTRAHPIFRLVGAFRGGGARPGSDDKHAILDR